MSSLIPFVFVALTFMAITQVPPAVRCTSDDALKCNCPAGPPGMVIPGEDGPAGQDCVVMQFPDGSFGCIGRDDKRFQPIDIFGSFTYRIDPTKFWLIVLVCAILPPLIYRTIKK